MKIGFLLTPYQRYSGAGKYYHSLIPHLVARAPQHTYTLYLPSNGAEEAAGLFPGARCVATRIPNAPSALRAAVTTLSGLPRGERPDVMHYVNIPFCRFAGPSVFTAYDLREEDVPSINHPVHNLFHRLTKRRWLRRADAVICISDFTLERLICRYPFCAGKSRRIYLGVGPEFTSVQSAQRPDRPYVLAVGHIEPHKNYRALVSAFRLLVAERRIERDLVIVGHEYVADPVLRQLVSDPLLAGRVRLVGRVSDEALLDYYQQSDLFVFPSLYEGFGLPLVEAMACGVPFVCSRIGAFQELAHGQDVFFDPSDIRSMAAAIERMLTNEPLRRAAAEWGRRTAAHYTWERTAAETLAVYEGLVGSRGTQGSNGRD